MAYDEQLAARIRDHLVGVPVVEKKMFGGAGVPARRPPRCVGERPGGMLVRVAPADSDATARRAGRGPHADDATVPPMDGWIGVAPEVLDDDEVLARWVERGVAFARSAAAQGLSRPS